eukprot:9202514-Pyramimonas_sp.AAC.1
MPGAILEHLRPPPTPPPPPFPLPPSSPRPPPPPPHSSTPSRNLPKQSWEGRGRGVPFPEGKRGFFGRGKEDLVKPPVAPKGWRDSLPSFLWKVSVNSRRACGFLFLRILLPLPLASSPSEPSPRRLEHSPCCGTPRLLQHRRNMGKSQRERRAAERAAAREAGASVADG